MPPRLEGKSSPAPFHYFDKGNLAIIGAFYAVMDSFGIRSAGLLAYCAWFFIHLQFLGSSLNRFRTGLQWLWMFSTNQLVGRLIIEPRGAKSVPESIH
jgi:NADH:ubiquinone reductase (H+-translocating)